MARCVFNASHDKTNLIRRIATGSLRCLQFIHADTSRIGCVLNHIADGWRLASATRRLLPPKLRLKACNRGRRQGPRPNRQRGLPRLIIMRFVGHPSQTVNPRWPMPVAPARQRDGINPPSETRHFVQQRRCLHRALVEFQSLAVAAQTFYLPYPEVSLTRK